MRRGSRRAAPAAQQEGRPLPRLGHRWFDSRGKAHDSSSWKSRRGGGRARAPDRRGPGRRSGRGRGCGGAAASNQILNWNSDLCLGINGGGGEWGRTAIQWDCNGNPDQKWNFWASSGSYSTVKNENGLCLGIRNASTDLGAEALQWQCNGNDDQKWSITPAPGGGYRFVNKHSGFCLGIWGGHTNQGERAIQWSCNGNADQTWYFG
ncbi:RICIN domain-containing protein [Streptomyces virginiae]|uniref:RICIN domain-containing protein n=1 Tax=Streptomyces virginiae TaxID=1961 RepID=UPI003319D71E